MIDSQITVMLCLFTTYTVEDGSTVKIDKQLAFEHVRTCMNLTKKHVDIASIQLVMIPKMK